MKTNLAKIQIRAHQLLYLDYTIKSMDIFVDHPFFSSVIVGEMIEGKTQILDIRNPDEWAKAQAHTSKAIKRAENVESIMFMVENPWKLFFFKRIHMFLDEELYGNLLMNCWTSTEFPNRDIDISIEELLTFFQKGKKEYLMSYKDLKEFSKMPDVVTIYRGFYSEEYYDALSWTINKGVASYFSSRLGQEGAIFKAEIDKEDIYAYTDSRGEKEIICDYKMIHNLKRIK